MTDTRLQPRHRRLAFFAAGIVLVFAVAEIGARVVMSSTPDAVRWYDEAAQLKVAQMDERGPVDVVVAGTSMAWQAIVPSVLDEATGGETTYNAGLDGGTPEVMERWLLEEVVPRTEPDTVIWGLSSYDLAPHYGDRQREAYDASLAGRRGPLAELDRSVAEWSSLVANRTVLRSLYDTFGRGADERATRLTDAAERLGAGGERLDFRIDRSTRQRSISHARLREFSPDPADIEAITRVVRELQDLDIEVVLVELPVSSGFVEAHPRGATDHARTTAALAALSGALDVRFLTGFDDTALDEAALDDTDFVDDVHLSEDGAHDFSRQLAAALASDRDDRGTTVEPAPSTESTPDLEDTCTTRTIIDDYGFEVEIRECAPSGPAPDAPPDETVAPPDEPAAPAPVDPGPVDPDRVDLEQVDPEVRRAAKDRDRRCREGLSPTPTLMAMADAIDGVRRGLEVAPTDLEARTRTYAQLENVALDSGACTTPTDDPEVRVASAAVAGSLDRLHALLDTPTAGASAIWEAADRISTALWVRDARASGVEVDGIVFGNSIARDAIDPRQLGDATVSAVGQASVNAASFETTGPWLDEVTAAIDPTTVYWAITYYDLYAICDLVDDRAEEANRAAQRRADAFSGMVPADSRRIWDHLLGPDESLTGYGSSPILDAIDREQVVATRGAARPSTAGPREDLVDHHISQIGEIWQPGDACTSRNPFVVEAVARLQAAGHEVVLFSVPPNPRFADEAPGGMTEFFEHTQALADQAAPDRYIALDAPLGGEHFRDGVHLLDSGRRLLTAALAAELAE